MLINQVGQFAQPQKVTVPKSSPKTKDPNAVPKATQAGAKRKIADGIDWRARSNKVRKIKSLETHMQELSGYYGLVADSGTYANVNAKALHAMVSRFV